MNQVPPRDSASVILVRKSAEGYQALLVRKHADLAFAGGSLVFPGGKVEVSDLLDDALYVNETGITVSDLMLELITACCRECFEEIGVLLAVNQNGETVSPALLETLSSMRDDIDKEPSLFGKMLVDYKLRIDLSTFLLWANWITPSLSPKRFNAHFLLAPMPENQSVQCDTAESTEEFWVNLSDFTAITGRAVVKMPPTLYPLADLADNLRQYGSLESLFYGERSRRVIPVMPKMHKVGERFLSYMPWHNDYVDIPGEGVDTDEFNPLYETYPDIVEPSIKIPGMPKL